MVWVFGGAESSIRGGHCNWLRRLSIVPDSSMGRLVILFYYYRGIISPEQSCYISIIWLGVILKKMKKIV